jgi:enolase
MAEMVSGNGRRGHGRAKERADSRADRSATDASQLPANAAGGFLERGWVIANHKLVSFHAAFISSVLSVPADAHDRGDVLRFMFASPETITSLAILYLSWHIGIAIHEMGHYLTAARLTALNRDSQKHADEMRSKTGVEKALWYVKMFLLIPWGKFEGVKKEEGNFVPDAPYNLAVAAAAPVWSGWLAMICLPMAAICIFLGLYAGYDVVTIVGRFFLAPGAVGLLDRFLADRGKLKEFRVREQRAAEEAARATAAISAESWLARVKDLKQQMSATRTQTVTLADGSKVTTPWQWRNCGMGGLHTQKEYPESNISMQESMFIPLSPKTFEDAQEMTVKLQYRLKEVIESAAGAKVMGIGSEGGLSAYIDKEANDRVPEQRLWRMMKQTILDCGYVPGVDVAIALDPAASALEQAYRDEKGEKDSVGMYRFWRDAHKVDMSRDEILELYRDAMENDGIPIVSIEDGFGERDHAGWKLLMEKMGDRIFVIGDDLVTTKDSNIEECARNGEINAALIKANQIGTLSETILAMLTAMAYGAELVVSHRSKSPNDPFEADIATAMDAVGMKCGGGANTERLQKYGRVMEILAVAQAGKRRVSEKERKEAESLLKELVVTLTGRKDVELAPNASEFDMVRLVLRVLAIEMVTGTEEATNTGIPSAAATIFLGKSGTIRFKGSTPLGASTGEDEAIHFVDSMIVPSEITRKHPDLFQKMDDGTLRFVKSVRIADIESKQDPALLALWKEAQRYDGKGCLEAVAHIENILGQAFVGRNLAQLGKVEEVDRELLALEKAEATKLGWLAPNAPVAEQIHIMQRKAAVGMNAILSMSIALGRVTAAKDGKELWQLVRETATDTMAKFILANAKDAGGKDLAALKAMPFEDVRSLYCQTAGQAVKEGKAIHELLRQQLPIYTVNGG